MLLASRSRLMVAGVLLVTTFFTAAADQQEMWEEPSHQLVFERGDTRILNIRVVPGATSEFHNHRFATVYFILQDARLQSQEYDGQWSAETDRPYRSPGSLMDRADYVEKNTFHRVKNPDNKIFHLVSVVNSATPAVANSAAGDGELNNGWFAEHRISLAPGESSQQLQFSNEVVLVQSHKGAAHVLENGVIHSVTNMPGAWSWHAAGSRFQVVNDDADTRQFVLIEVKNQSAP